MSNVESREKTLPLVFFTHSARVKHGQNSSFEKRTFLVAFRITGFLKSDNICACFKDTSVLFQVFLAAKPAA